MSPSEFITQWGTSNLFPVPVALIDRLDIPADDKAFLLKAGLPLTVQVFPETCSSSVLSIASDRSVLPRYPLFSPSPFMTSDCLMLIRLDRGVADYVRDYYWNEESVLFLGVEVGSGHIRVIAPPNRAIRGSEVVETAIDDFANSSIVHMLESMLAMRTFHAHYWFRRTYSRHQVPPLIDSLEAKLRRIDAAAMANAANWWPKCVEVVRRNYQHQMEVRQQEVPGNAQNR